MSAEQDRCTECGEPATRHSENCWLGPKVAVSEPDFVEKPGEYRASFRDRHGVIRELTPGALLADALEGFADDSTRAFAKSE